MNKKLFLGMFAAAGMLLATSCSNDELDVVQSGNEAQVSFSLGLEGGIATRAISDGTTANQLMYAVFDQDGKRITTIDKEVKDATFPTTANITLAKGQTYKVAFWAQNKACDAYTVSDDMNVTIDYAGNNNDETRDAFFKTVEFTVIGSTSIDVEMKRPFAQINVGVTKEDWNAAVASGIEIKKSSVVIENAANYLNLVTGTVGSSTSVVSYELDIIPEQFTTPEVLKVDTDDDGVKEEYKWLSMSYILPADLTTGYANTTLENVAFVFEPEKGNEIEFNKGLNAVPVRRNWRTNILGKLLTGDIQFNITIDPVYDGDINYPDEAAQELELAAKFGGAVTLTEDVELEQPLEVVADMVLNLNGKTISGKVAKGIGAVVDIADGVTAKIFGGTIESTTENGDAAINNAGNLVLENVTINGAPLADGGYSAYAVISSGNLVIEESTVVSADRGCLKFSGAGETIINGGHFTNNDIGARTLTSHVVDVEDGGTHKLTINGGTFEHLHTTTSGGVVICNRTRGIVYVNGGNYSGGNYYGNNNLSDYGYGGTFAVTGGVYSANPAAKYLVAGYKSVAADGVYYILPEVVADAAAAANVTTVTENTADVATALSTDNGEATMFMWNDVAYIAKYGEVVITSSADEATTTRGVVEGASGLTSATVAEGIEVVGNRTFRKCSNLETVVFPNTLTEIGPAVFQSCSKLANVTIPAGVKTIGESAFAECTSLTSINIPNGVTRLEKDVLRNTGLVSIEIPASVNYIGTYAFRDCESLTEVKILSPEFTIENNTFTNMAAPVPTMTIYVVNAEMKAYLDSVLTNYDKSYITVVVM